MSARAFVGLGSNLGDRLANLAGACRRLAALPSSRLVRTSAVYETAPVGLSDQPWFYNAVAELETELDPLLRQCLAVEAEFGRRRDAGGPRWGPRPLDLDLLLAGDLVVSGPDLVLPHPRLAERAFVLVPLAELDPGLMLPVGRRVGELLDALMPGQALRPAADPLWPPGAPAPAAPAAAGRGADPPVTAGAVGPWLEVTGRLGRPWLWRPEVGSTNDWARDLVRAGAPEGTACAAEVQTRGRGRLGRGWVSPPGGLWLSVVLRPPAGRADLPQLGLVAAVALAEAVEAVTGLSPAIKWPNDLLVDGGKAAGILVEGAPDQGWVVLGTGVNCNVSPDALPGGLALPATALVLRTGDTVARGRLAGTFLNRLEEGYRAWLEAGFGWCRAAYQRRLAWSGREVVARGPAGTWRGRLEGVDGAGRAVLSTPEGTRYLQAGELSLRRSSAGAGSPTTGGEPS